MTTYVESSGRFGVRLYGEKGDKAILPKNLRRYQYDGMDACRVCSAVINLNAFPSCNCNPSGAHKRDEDDVLFGDDDGDSNLKIDHATASHGLCSAQCGDDGGGGAKSTIPTTKPTLTSSYEGCPDRS